MNVLNQLLIFCVGVAVGGHDATNFSNISIDVQENSTSFDINVITGGLQGKMVLYKKPTKNGNYGGENCNIKIGHKKVMPIPNPGNQPGYLQSIIITKSYNNGKFFSYNWSNHNNCWLYFEKYGCPKKSVLALIRWSVHISNILGFCGSFWWTVS